MNGRLVMGALAMLWPVTAHADPLERGALRLEWSAPGGCPNGVEVLDRIEALLGTRIADLRPEPITARGSVTAVEALRFALELETYQKDQRFARSMQAPSCTELTDAGALVLALAIDPELVERQARAAEEKPETSALPPDPPAAPPVAPAPPPPPTRRPPRDVTPRREVIEHRLEWFARLGLLADLGTVSDNGFGPRATVAAGFRSFRAELGILWLPPVRSFTARNPDRGGDIDLVAGELAGCWVPLRGDAEFEACAGVELGRVHGEGFGTVIESEGSAFWYGAGATLLARFRASDGLFVVASGGPLFVPQDTEFTLENVGVVHRVPNVVSRFGLGIEAAFQ